MLLVRRDPGTMALAYAACAIDASGASVGAEASLAAGVASGPRAIAAEPGDWTAWAMPSGTVQARFVDRTLQPGAVVSLAAAVGPEAFDLVVPGGQPYAVGASPAGSRWIALLCP